MATAGVIWATLSFKSSPMPVGNALASPTSESTTTAPPPPIRARVTTTTVPPLRTYVGATEMNRWGPVQVEIVERGAQIVDVRALQLPSRHPRSLAISNEAAPTLRYEVLQAQGARINGVSGATYTSDGYALSVQSAIDQARRGV